MARVIDVVIRLRNQFTGTLRNVNASLNQFQRQASYAGRSMVSVGKDMEKVGKNISTKVSLPIIGLGVAASEAATKFKHEMADIRKEVEARGLPESKVNSVMTEMSNKALKWSEDFGQSTESINEGLLTLVKDGYSADEAMSAMNTSLLTARGANEELSTVVDQLGSSLEAYGMKTNNSAQTTKNMAHMADTFAYIANHTKASITSLGEAFSVAGSTANAMHQPMAQTAAAIGILESNGVDANTAATALKAGLVNLTKPTTKMQKALKQMGFSAFDSKGHMKDLATILNEVEKKTEGWTDQQKQAAIATIFGKESLASWNILLHKGGGYLSDLANSANGATGEVQKLSDSMKNTEQNKFKELTQSVHALGIAFGTDILPSIIPIVDKLTDMVKSFANLDEGTKQAIIKFAMIAAAIGPPILILGKLTHGIGETILSFTKLSRSIASAGGILKYLATPGGMVIVVITAVALAAFLLIKYWGPISTFFKKLWADILAITQRVWAVIGPVIIGAVTKIAKFWNAIWPELKGILTLVFIAFMVIIGPKLTAIYVLIKAVLGFIIGSWKDSWNLTKNTLKLVWDLIINVIRVAWDLVSGIIEVGLDILTGNWGQAWTHIKEMFISLWNDLKTLFGDLIKDALQWGKDFIQGLIDGIKGAAGGVVDAVKNVAGGIKSFLHFSKPDTGPLADYETWMPDFMQGMGRGITVNAHLVTDKVKDVALGIKTNMQQGTSSSDPASARSGVSGITIAKLADAIIVREEADIDKIANALVQKIKEAAINMA